jgi:molybdopterin converting factor small subunit
MNNVTIGDYPETEEQYLDVEGTSVLGIEVNGNGIQNAVSVLAHGEAKVYTGKEKSGMKNITPFTKAEAEAQVKKLEQKFKEVVGILADIGYLIEEMDRRKGWGEIGYKDYTEWASGRLGCERSFAYVYKNAAAFDMRSLESGDEELVQFSNQAALEHKAILVKVPKGKEREAIHKAKEVASAEGKKPTADHYKRVVDDILSRGVDEESREVLTNEDIEFPVWRKTKNRSNIPTLEAALPYWRKLLEESRDDEIEGRKAERRINLIEERIEKLSRKGKPNASDSSSTGEQEVKGEIPELARAMTEEYLKELPSDDDRASALISSVEGDSRHHINAIAEQFPINQRSEALLEIEKVFAQKHEEYLKSIGVNASSETNSEESSGVGTAEESLAIASPDTAAPDNQDASTGGEESAEMETTSESLAIASPDTAAPDNQDASTGGEESAEMETTSESLAIASPDTAAPDNQDASTGGEESSGVGTTSESLAIASPDTAAPDNQDASTGGEESAEMETTSESLAIASPDTAAPDNQDASTGGEESAEMETTGESLTPMLDTAATDNQAASTGGDESSGVGTTSESLAIASPDTAATDNQGASTSGEESAEMETTSDRLLRTSPNAFFDCSSVEELKAYINEVDPGQIWEETQDLYKHWARLSEKVGDSETELEQKRIEVKELEKKVKEKDAELKEQEKLIQQLRSIVASLEGQIKEYQSLSASEEYEAPENQEF